MLKVVLTPVDDPVVDANHMFNVINTRETEHALRGMPLIKAKKYLEDVLAHKQSILFIRLCRGNAVINAEVKGWMWILFTSFTSKRTRHKNKDVVHLVLMEELTNADINAETLNSDNLNKQEYLLVRRPPINMRRHQKKSFLMEIFNASRMPISTLRLDVDALHIFYIQANQTQKQRRRTSRAHGRINPEAYLVQKAFRYDASPVEGGRYYGRCSRVSTGVTTTINRRSITMKSFLKEIFIASRMPISTLRLKLDALGASVSDEDANHKFLRSLPPAWDSLAMTMRTKKNIDTLSIDDLYNNLSVFEQDIQKTSSSSLTSDNVAFLSQAKASSSKHKPHHNSGSYSSYTTSSSKATPTATPGLADEVIHSFLATNADDVDLIHEDLDQIDDLDLEEMDINWQIAMTAIKIKKFYKKTGRRPRVDGKMHVAFDKRKVECFNCHNTGHFARECKFKGTKDGSRQEASRGQDFKPVRTEKEALMTIDEGQINWVEQTTDEEINHALMAFTVNNEVSMCSKLCLDSYNALKAKYDELQSEFGDQEAALTAHKIGLKKVEAQLNASHKQQISLNEKLLFQANQIFEKDEKLKKYRRIGMKAVKDKDALQKIVDSWFASSKNLWKLIDCGMSSTVKLGLGYSIKSNAEVLSYEEEMDRGIFASIRETDPGYHDIPLYSRFKQVENKGVPHPLSGDYTPREQEDIDDSLYEYGKYGPQPQTPSPTVSNTSSIVFSICPSNDKNEELGAVSDASSTHYSTCPSNDSDGELGTVTDLSVNDDPISTQKIHSEVPTPTQTVDPSCAQHVKPPRQPIRTPVTSSPIPLNNRQNWNQRMQRDLGAGFSFERKPCFVCGSLSHLIKNCDYYEKKMAREAALKSKRVVHTNDRQATPAWNNTNRINKANQFTPRPVNVRPNLSTASNTIKTGRVNV
ncbi:ribonuclease H-like domain-containing protein, partial [Tanacetum coccineum]